MNKKVLVLTTSFPVTGFPVGMHVYNKCKFLVKKGIDITVVAPHYPMEKFREIKEGIKIIRFPYFFPFSLQKVAYLNGMPQNIKASLLAKFQVPFFFLSFLIYSLKFGRKCQIIHAHWFPAGLVGVIAKKFLAKKLVLMMHHTHDSNSIFKFILHHTDYLLTNSNYVLQVTRNICDVAHSEVIPIGLDTDQFNTHGASSKVRNKLGLSEETILIFSVGRFINLKGFEYLIEAVHLLNQETKNKKKIHLMIAGQGPRKNYYKELIEEFHLNDQVDLIGYVPNNEIHRYYHSADIFVIPSVFDEKGETEGFGVVSLEASVCSLPVIASRAGGIVDIIEDGYNGFLVDQKDAKGIAEKILLLANDRELRKKMGENSRKWVIENYDWDTISERIIEVYQEVS